MQFEIPAGLTDLLQEFTVAVLRRKPTDLVEFAATYFADRRQRRQDDLGVAGVRFPDGGDGGGGRDGAQSSDGYSDSEESDFG